MTAPAATQKIRDSGPTPTEVVILPDERQNQADWHTTPGRLTRILMSDVNPLPLISAADSNSVPVFTCHVILSPADENGQLKGRTANLPGITAVGAAERDVLRSILEQFKSSVQKYSAMQQPVPFVDPPERPGAGEVERFIPMHL